MKRKWVIVLIQVQYDTLIQVQYDTAGLWK